MDSLTDWLLKMVQPMIVRIMGALGLSVVTVDGVQTAFDQARSFVQSSINSMPEAVLQLCGLFGVDQAVSWILGAMSFSLTIYAMRRFFSFFGMMGAGGTSS